MLESRSISAVIIGVVSVILIGAAWFFLIRKPDASAGRKAPSRGSDPYSSYYRDMGQIADSLSTPKPAPAQNAPTAPGTGLPPSTGTPGQTNSATPANGIAPAAQPGYPPAPGMQPAGQPTYQPAGAPASSIPGR